MASLTEGCSINGIAVFDLDGTLLAGDSLIPFLLHYGAREKRTAALARLPMYLVGLALRIRPADWTKEHLCRAFLGGQALGTIRARAQEFCNRWLQGNLNPVGVERLKQHRKAGHRIILLTAGPDILVESLAAGLGIREVVCTKLIAVGKRCWGWFDGPNCKGSAKLERLADYLHCRIAPRNSFAYGDSRSDLPVLRWVEHGFLLQGNQFAPVTRG
jgi:phosphatidylglycerophosphatase C